MALFWYTECSPISFFPNTPSKTLNEPQSDRDYGARIATIAAIGTGNCDCASRLRNSVR